MAPDRDAFLPERDVNRQDTGDSKRENTGDSKREPIGPPIPAKGTHRFTLTTRPDSSSIQGAGSIPFRPSGPAIILGKNPIAFGIAGWFKDCQSDATIVDASLPWEQIDRSLDKAWESTFPHHLFLTTPWDQSANWSTDQWNRFQDRGDAAMLTPFRMAQKWLTSAIERGIMDNASIASIVRGNGDFQFSLLDPLQLEASSGESGGIAGLTKAMLIESWMRGFRKTPIVIVDVTPSSTMETSVQKAIEGVAWRLAHPSHDEEVSVGGKQPSPVDYCHRPLPMITENGFHADPKQIQPGTPWVVAGGGRGITAMTAIKLAEKYDLRLHLMGMAPVPHLDENTRRQAREDRIALRRKIYNDLQKRGENAVRYWRQFEKQIEIDETLHVCHERGIRAQYHQVNVSDLQSVESALEKIRSLDGPIHGVIQGAGSGQDARFDRKRPDKVRQCLSAKIDGTVALATATMNDPLQWFIGFGSISGRFGANGHTDYSAANDMMAKLISRLKVKRPATRCVTFHWHAWGDIGMATKPEAKLALDMIGIQWMPAADGLNHFMRELEHGGQDTEVLITDRRYIQKFFASRIIDRDRESLPLLNPANQIEPHDDEGQASSKNHVTLTPAADRFLSDHLVGGRPTLPFVAALELMAQRARRDQPKSSALPIRFQNAKAIRPLKWMNDDSLAVEVDQAETNSLHNQPETPIYQVRTDLRRKDGRLVEAGRVHFESNVQFLEKSFPPPQVDPALLAKLKAGCLPDSARSSRWASVEYLPEDAPIFHGESLRSLQKVAWKTHQVDQSVVGLHGQIMVPSPVELAGDDRPVGGWSVPLSVADGVLYAAGMLTHALTNSPNLPVGFERLEIWQPPVPGETLLLNLDVTTNDSPPNQITANQIAANQSIDMPSEETLVMHAVLARWDGTIVLKMDGYRIGLMRS